MTFRAASAALPARSPAVLSAALAWVVVLGTVLVLIGWLADVPALTEIGPGPTSMKFNTAGALCLFALALAFPSRLPRALIVVACAGVIALAGVTLLEWVAGRGFGIDELVVSDTRTTGKAPGRMAVSTAGCLTMLAGCRLTLSRLPRLAEVLGAVAFGVGLVAVLGHTFGSDALYRYSDSSSMALPTASAIAALGLALLALVPGGRMPWVLTGADPGAALLRELLPVVVIVLPAIGYFALRGERSDWFAIEGAIAILVCATAVMVVAVAYRFAAQVRRHDAARSAALDEVTRLNADLESLVAKRTAALLAERERVLVHQERDRIANDFHDHAIQQIFSVTLQLRTAMYALDPEGRGYALAASIINELDDTTADIRRVIFDLRTAVVEDGVLASVEALVERSRRMLGRAPALTVTGDLDDGTIPPACADAMLAVLGEGLANVARHAGASMVTVEVSRGPERLLVAVIDDGAGMPADLPHRGGVAGIEARAAALGGGATWAEGNGGGTRLEWWVPATRGAREGSHVAR